MALRNHRSLLRSRLALSAACLSMLTIAPASAVWAKEKPAAAEAAPVADLVSSVDIPYESFTLDNGLKVIVHEDRKAPIVAVSIWYGVGSKHEPKGKTGYAHLFEHIMFNGSENAPEDYFVYLKNIGATDYNGTTYYDRTNYFQTVPRGALESALFIESDRLGNLLGAVTQEKLTNQIGVVQNEKRQGDNQPYGLVRYVQGSVLFPEGHPYHHTTIGSMADLSAATLDDMHNWFKDHYGPNNAVLVLAGDISAAEAKPMVEKWFGRFPAGKPLPEINAPIPTLSERSTVVLHDKVPTTAIIYSWAVPGLNDPDFAALDVGASVLGGLASSRLDNILVRDEKLAVSVSSYVIPLVHASIFTVTVNVAPGQDVDVVGKRLDEIMADYIANGPTADEVSRVATSDASGRIRGLEVVGGFGGKAVTLAEGQLYSNNPAHYKTQLSQLAAQTPQSVQGAMQTWLSRPVAEIRVVPGERDPAETAAFVGGVTGNDTLDPSDIMGAPEQYSDTPEADAEQAAVEAAAEAAAEDLTKMPAPGAPSALDLPDVETAKLKNGATVYLAKRDAVPVVRVSVSFEAGYASDGVAKQGTAAFATRMMQEGTTTRDSKKLSEDQERLGANISGGSDLEQTEFGVVAMKANLAPSLDLLADVVRNPAFDEAEIERVRVQQLSGIDSEMSQPAGMANRLMPVVLYGEGHPYAMPASGSGTKEVVSALTKADLQAFHQTWVRPDNMTVYVVGDTSMKEVLPLLNASFGDWKAPKKIAKGKVVTDVPAAKPEGRIIVLNRPGSPQSYITAGQILPLKGTDELTTLYAANELLGGDFLSRINMDLRETKGWSYGTRTSVQRRRGQVPFIVTAPVQADKTGPAVLAVQEQLNGFLGDKPVTAEERDRVATANILQLPGRYETAGSVLGQMQSDVKYGRPFTYAEGTAARYEALTTDNLSEVMRGVLSPKDLIWVIVGDAEVIRPQLENIGMPVEYIGEGQ